MEMVQDSFRGFAAATITPHAEHVHRTNGDVPEEIISGLAELGAFGLSVPAEYGGFSEGGDDEYLAMVVATEELSRASLGIGGSLITPPRDPHQSTGERRHRGAEAALAAAAGERRGDAGRRRHRARLRQRCGRHHGHRRARRRTRRSAWMGDQRGQDVVHAGRPRRRPRPAGPHRPRPLQGTPRAEPVRGPQAARRRARVPPHAGARR